MAAVIALQVVGKLDSASRKLDDLWVKFNTNTPLVNESFWAMTFPDRMSLWRIGVKVAQWVHYPQIWVRVPSPQS